tara:strand:- start:1407 stop:1904 length:498 start_codon:yes stop_codon:yes gene_type:complete
MCGRCLNVYYCDKTCQSLAFFDHWSYCSNLNSKVNDRDVLAFRAWFKDNEENFQAISRYTLPSSHVNIEALIFKVIVSNSFHGSVFHVNSNFGSISFKSMLKNKRFADTARKKLISKNNKALVIFLLNNTRALATEFDCSDEIKPKIIHMENTVNDVIKRINTSN